MMPDVIPPAPGAEAPDFALKNTSGGTLRLSDYQKNGPALLVFFRGDCPCCRLALPFVERLYRRHGRGAARFLGILQAGRQEAAALAKEMGLMMPFVLEEAPAWEASAAYGLKELPALVLVDAARKVLAVQTGFSKRGYQQMADRLAALSGKAPEALFDALASVPESAAGSPPRSA